MNIVERLLYITIIILLFQIMRNVNTVVYVSLLFLSYFSLYIVYIYSIKSKQNANNMSRLRIAPMLFIMSLLFIPFVSLLNMDSKEFFIALPRYLITLPFIVFTAVYKGYNLNFTKKIFQFIIFFMVVSSLTIPYQIVFGNISFFADPSIRNGLVRYASLAGSLTAIGTLGAYSLVMLLFSGNLFFSNGLKNFFIILNLLGLLMSLQKAAIANIIISFCLYILFNKKIKLYKRILVPICFFASIYGGILLLNETKFAIYIQDQFTYTFTDSSLGITADLMGRLWERPFNVIEYNNINFLDFITGIGFPALAGTMGLTDLPMAHNNYFDLILSGGIVHFFTFLYLLLRIPILVAYKKNKGLKINEIDISYSMTIILMLINMAIGAQTFYQPICAVFTFIIIFSYDKSSNSLNNFNSNI